MRLSGQRKLRPGRSQEHAGRPQILSILSRDAAILISLACPRWCGVSAGGGRRGRHPGDPTAGHSPAGLSATGDSDTRNYYDMLAARQALDLRPQLDRLDALILRSAGLDPAALTYRFRPLWQLSAADKAAVALQKAQATQIYAGLGLWDTATTARLVQSQLVEDGVYPGAAEVFGAGEAAATLDYRPDQPRDPQGRWTEAGGASGQESDPPNPSAYEATAPEMIFHQVDLPISPAAHHRERERRRRGRRSGPGGHLHRLEELFGPSEPEKSETSPERPPSQPHPTISEPASVKSTLPSDPPPSVPQPASADPSPSPAERGSSIAPPPPARFIPDLPGITRPGYFAGEPIPAKGSGLSFNGLRAKNAENGFKNGYHRCGTRDPGTDSGFYIMDHQRPTALNLDNSAQFIYPHCRPCSTYQGGIIRGIIRRWESQ